MRILIVGDGKMGQAVAALAATRGHAILGILGREENTGGRALTPALLAGADVAIEFTDSGAVAANLERLIEARVAVVTGTTGWTAALPRIEGLVAKTGGALLHASNFSAGVHFFLRTARDLARHFTGQTAFESFVLDEHHAAKRDAPSGTALSLQAALLESDPSRKAPITSIRAGSIPGTHVVAYDGPSETVTLSHVARNREAFASGALAAAEWLPGHPGVHTFEEMLFGTRE